MHSQKDRTRGDGGEKSYLSIASILVVVVLLDHYQRLTGNSVLAVEFVWSAASSTVETLFSSEFDQ